MPDDATPIPEAPSADRLAHLLWEVHARASLIGEAALADTPLTFASIGVLDLAGTYPGITIADITRRTTKSQQAISQVVARLEKLGYIERRLAGGRSVGLHVTEAGEQARAAGNAAEEAFDARLRDELGDELYHQLRARLREARAALADQA